ncbi:hypothetical protein [Vibrio diazotrophicus]|uniref:hypothetical protein n=1 Tax=Vibrio diazotrophicus TaxID=685 RepID=UPI003D2F8075
MLKVWSLSVLLFVVLTGCASTQVTPDSVSLKNDIILNKLEDKASLSEDVHHLATYWGKKGDVEAVALTSYEDEVKPSLLSPMNWYVDSFKELHKHYQTKDNVTLLNNVANLDMDCDAKYSAAQSKSLSECYYQQSYILLFLDHASEQNCATTVLPLVTSAGVKYGESEIILCSKESSPKQLQILLTPTVDDSKLWNFISTLFPSKSI